MCHCPPQRMTLFDIIAMIGTSDQSWVWGVSGVVALKPRAQAKLLMLREGRCI